MAQALVPLKDLVQAKSRLAGLMSPAERRGIVQAMVEDVLAVLAGHPALERVTLVSDDPAAGMLARTYGADLLEEASLRAPGLNPVIEAAIDRLQGGASDPFIVLHADLPLLGPGDISAVIDRYHSSPGLVIGCDRHRRGSNLLAFGRDRRPRFCFGSDSYRAHRAAAGKAGIAFSELYRPGIALDLDEPGDVAELMRCLSSAGRHTRNLLTATDLGRRLSLVVGALESGDGSRAIEGRSHD
jgi:2-phospho-L-lactate guanylyltransferase